MRDFNLEEYNKGRKVCLRNGDDVKILATDFKFEDGKSILASFKRDGFDIVVTLYSNGRLNYLAESEFDIVMANEKHIGWINQYRSVLSGIMCFTEPFSTKEEAEKDFKFYKRMCTHKIEWYE